MYYEKNSSLRMMGGQWQADCDTQEFSFIWKNEKELCSWYAWHLHVHQKSKVNTNFTKL